MSKEVGMSRQKQSKGGRRRARREPEGRAESATAAARWRRVSAGVRVANERSSCAFWAENRWMRCRVSWASRFIDSSSGATRHCREWTWV